MNVMTHAARTESLEAELDRKLDHIGNKIVAGDATKNDRALYEELAVQRTDLMDPRIGIAELLARRRNTARNFT